MDGKTFDYNDCYITEVINVLHAIVHSPNVQEQNKTFTQHIAEAIIKCREEKHEHEVPVPWKLEDGWKPTTKITINNIECNALYDLGPSVSIMPKALYDVLVLKLINERSLSFIIMDIEWDSTCPINLKRPFLKTIGVAINMNEGNIQF